MNKTKRGLQLSAAIVSIVFASILLIGSIEMLDVLDALYESTEAEALASSLDLLYTIYSLVMLFSIAIIVVSSLICRKPKAGTHKGLVIADLAMNGVLVVLYILSTSIYFMCMPLISVGLFVASLCVKNIVSLETTQNTSQVVNTSTPETNVEKNEADSFVTDVAIIDEVSANIDRFRKLNKDGVITDEELKTLIQNETKKLKK